MSEGSTPSTGTAGEGTPTTETAPCTTGEPDAVDLIPPRGRQAGPAVAVNAAGPLTGGVWFVFDTDWYVYPIAVYPDEPSAQRHADRMAAQVTFWPYGVYWSEINDR